MINIFCPLEELTLPQINQDDANIPSLLSAPMFGYVSRDDPIYQNTRRFVLSKDNPYFMFGPVIDSFVAPFPPFLPLSLDPLSHQPPNKQPPRN